MPSDIPWLTFGLGYLGAALLLGGLVAWLFWMDYRPWWPGERTPDGNE